MRKGRIPLSFIENETSPGKYLMPREPDRSNEKPDFSIKAANVPSGAVRRVSKRDKSNQEVQEDPRPFRRDGPT